MPVVVHEIHKLTNPLLPFILHDGVLDGDTHGAANWHENVEILAYTQGEGTLYLDGKHYKALPHDVAVVNVGRIHATDGGPCHRYCLIVDTRFCEENGIPVRSLQFDEFFRDASVAEALCAICADRDAIQNGTADAVTAADLRYRVLGLLLYLCRSHAHPTEEEATADTRSLTAVREAIRYLQASRGRVTLDQVAARVHMSKYHLSHEFKRVTGTSVLDYLLAFRCDHARRLLQEGAKVSEAAAAAGFENLSYFSRTFRRYVGVLPSRCRRP